jgi:hypothetical protein
MAPAAKKSAKTTATTTPKATRASKTKGTARAAKPATPSPARRPATAGARRPVRSARPVRAAYDIPPDLSAVPVADIRLAGLHPRALIAPNFRVYELTKSEVASRQGIANDFPSEQELHAAIHLARRVLQAIRNEFGQISPNSVFRSQGVERALKKKPANWTSSSQHTRGEACDVEVPGVQTLVLAEWAANNLKDFDQIICECYDPRKGPNSGWVHISLRAPGTGDNRRQLLSYIPNAAGQFVYVDGLRAVA